MASVPLTAAEREDEAMAGHPKRLKRRWFNTRHAAGKRGRRSGYRFAVLECDDPECPHAPPL